LRIDFFLWYDDYKRKQIGPKFGHAIIINVFPHHVIDTDDGMVVYWICHPSSLQKANVVGQRRASTSGERWRLNCVSLKVVGWCVALVFLSWRVVYSCVMSGRTGQADDLAAGG
jgi:hypothetical protein